MRQTLRDFMNNAERLYTQVSKQAQPPRTTAETASMSANAAIIEMGHNIIRGEIVTPADEALAAVPPIGYILGSPIPPEGLTEEHVYTWLAARRKVADLDNAT